MMKRLALVLIFAVPASGIFAAAAGQLKSTEQYLQDLSSSDPAAQMEAVVVLGEKKEEKAVPGLIKLLNGNPEIAVQANASLAQIGKKDAAPAVLKAALESTDTNVQYAALLAGLVLRSNDAEIVSTASTIESSTQDPYLKDLASKIVKKLKK